MSLDRLFLLRLLLSELCSDRRGTPFAHGNPREHIEEGCKRERERNRTVGGIPFFSRPFLHRFLSAPAGDTANTLTSRIPCVSRSTFSPRSEVVWILSYIYQAYLRLLHTDMSVPARLTGYATFYCTLSNLCPRER